MLVIVIYVQTKLADSMAGRVSMRYIYNLSTAIICHAWRCEERVLSPKKVTSRIPTIYDGDYLNVEIVITDMVYSHKSSHVVGLIHILINDTDICTVHILHHTDTHYLI